MPVIAMGPAPSGPTSSRSRVHDASAVQNKFPNNGDRVPSTRGMLVYDIPGEDDPSRLVMTHRYDGTGTEKPSAVKHAPSRQRKPPKTTVAGGQPESTRMSRASLTSGGSSTIAAARPKSKDNRTDPGTTAEANRKITNAPRLVIVAPGPQAGLGEPGALDRNTSSRSLSPAPRNGHTASPRSAATEARDS
ncbi:hypothetical protein C2E23DRAFT_169792 [Lenzites betulinus]|nr:hypothetical protein C2E23DRAFT_169792 [Lenzites betulinus]